MVNPLNSTPSSTDGLETSRQSRASGTGTVDVRGASRKVAATSTSGTEKVQLSPRAQLARRLSASARTSDGVDPSRVQAVRNAAAGGASSVSPRDIATALLHHASGHSHD